MTITNTSQLVTKEAVIGPNNTFKIQVSAPVFVKYRGYNGRWTNMKNNMTIWIYKNMKTLETIWIYQNMILNMN